MNEQTWIKWMHVGSHYCHQMPERSFYFRGYQFPVCARCTGVLLGYIILLLSVWFWFPPLIVSAICFGVMVLDWSLQFFKLLPSNNIRRLVTGTLGGYGFLGMIFWLVKWGIGTFG